jgi:hypothetical protein
MTAASSPVAIQALDADAVHRSGDDAGATAPGPSTGEVGEWSNFVRVGTDAPTTCAKRATWCNDGLSAGAATRRGTARTYRRAAKPDDADVHETVHAADESFFKQGRES